MDPVNKTGPLIIGLGEAVWDIFGDDRKPGGAPANVAFHAGQHGARAVVATSLGTDTAGDDLLEYFQSKGLDSSVVQRDATHATGRVTHTLK